MRNGVIRSETNAPYEINEIPVKERTLLSLRKGEAQMKGTAQVFPRR
jgi:hypothetical protein